MAFNTASHYINHLSLEQSTLGRKAIRLADFHREVLFCSGPLRFYRIIRSTPYTESSLLDVSDKKEGSLEDTDNDPKNFVGLQALYNSYYYHDLIQAMPSFGRVWRLLELYNIIKDVVRQENLFVKTSASHFTEPNLEQFAIREIYSNGYSTGGVTSTPAQIEGITQKSPTIKNISVSSELTNVPKSKELSPQMFHEKLRNLRQGLVGVNDINRRESQKLSFTTVSTSKPVIKPPDISRSINIVKNKVPESFERRTLPIVPEKWYDWNTAPNVVMPPEQKPNTIRPAFQTPATYPNIAKGEQKKREDDRFRREEPIKQDDGSLIWTVTDKTNKKTWQVFIKPDGAPDFSPYLYDKGVNTVILTHEDGSDMTEKIYTTQEGHDVYDRRVKATGRIDDYANMANKLAGYSNQKPEDYEDYVWHHDRNNIGVLQFVRKDVHQSIYHVGAVSRVNKN